MHMTDALLSPAVGGGFWAAAIAAISYSARHLRKQIDDKLIPLMGVLGAFVFAAQMINFAIPGTGSSGHIGGGMLLAILLGPSASFIVVASILTVQGLFFADGGLLALGCNIWNLGVYPCFIAYPLVFRPVAGIAPSAKRTAVASVLSVVAALQLGAFSVVLQTRLSGISDLPFNSFLLLMQPIHLAIGVVEGIVTAGVVNYVRALQPEAVDASSSARQRLSYKKVLLAAALLAVITGGVLSWFASTRPDGLQWSIERITGAGELAGRANEVTRRAGEIQETTSLFPGYRFPGQSEAVAKETAEQWPTVNAGTSLAGLIGGSTVFGFVMMLGFGIRAYRKMRERRQGLENS